MKKVRISDICEVYDGPHATPTKTKFGPIYLGIKAITEDGFLDTMEFAHLSEEDYQVWTKRVTPKENDIVFSYEATLNRYALIPKDFYGCLGRRLAILRAKNDDLNIFWLYYYFQSPQWQTFISNHMISGSTVNRISIDDFPDYKINLPSRKEQDAIVAIINSVTNKIALNNKINAELESMAKTIYDYWFTQFDFPDENGRPYKSSGGKMVWNEELQREIPAGWEVKKLDNCIQSINTGLNPRDNFVLGSGIIKYVTVKNITSDGTLDFTGCDTIDVAARKLVHERSDISKGDILFASIAPLGRCYLIQSKPENWDINESVFSIRPDYAKVCSEYLYIYFMSDTFIKKASLSSTGSIFLGLRITALLNMQILLPPITIMNNFSKEISKLLFNKHINNEENQKLSQLRDWLLPMLMNGQIKVESDE